VKINVFGLGNVGLVTAICLAESGHKVIGIEINTKKAEMLLEKKLYIFENGLDEKFAKIDSEDRLKILSSPGDSDLLGDISIVCVGTPVMSSGQVILDQALQTMTQLSEIIENKNEKHTVVLRSTIPPGTIKKNIISKLEGKKNKIGINFDLVYFPEFLREGNAVEDFYAQDVNVIATNNPNQIKMINEIFRLNENYDIVDFEVAEMIKYMNNSFHALKVVFANEISSLCSKMDIDKDQLFDLFLKDKKLNISETYLRPGFSFGGPCLTKELKALNYFSKDLFLETSTIKSIFVSNNEHLKRFLGIIESLNAHKILFIGVCFKSGTDDIRNSPFLEIFRRIKEKPSYIEKN